DVRQIVVLQVSSLRRMLAAQGVELDVSDRAIDWLAAAGFDPQFGARPIKRALQKHLVNELSKAILAGKINRQKAVVVDATESGLNFSN
ncbi:MAG: type VI secretion system ATPase TssH, partial [Mucinivorans sp.]